MGVPQGKCTSVLCSVLQLLYSWYMLVSTIITSFVGETNILTIEENEIDA